MSLLRISQGARAAVSRNIGAQQQPFAIRRTSYSTMKALVYKSIGSVVLEDRPKPTLISPTDAIVKLTRTTLCGTDLHIRLGDLETATPGRILGHEGTGVIDQVGDSVTSLKKGDSVIISCVSSCGTCEYCRRAMASHCTTGGWILGNTIDGTQAEYVRIPHADNSLYKIPLGSDDPALMLLSDILPTGLECGVLNSKIVPGSTVAIVGGGPVGLAALLTAQLYSPSKIFVIDQDPARLAFASEFGATHTIPSDDKTVETVKSMTDGKGCDAVIEAVGIPATFEMCQKLVAPGGIIANLGVHGKKVDLHLEKLWDMNIAITTRLVDAVTTPMLLKLVKSKQLDASKLITHEFAFKDIEKAYDVFSHAAQHNALKINIVM